MFDVQFYATDDADWAASIDLVDDDTDEPLDLTGITFALGVSECGTVILSATTDAGTIETPDDGVIQWRFDAEDLGSLCVGTTYRVGCTMETADGVTQLFVGSLAFIDGSAP